jgi:hypothetical protein
MLGRRSRAAVIIAAGLSAGLLTTAGIAATAEETTVPTTDAAADETTVPEDETTVPEDETTVPEDDTTVSEDETATSADTERFWGAECGEGEPTNHGGYVSSTERDGETRSEAAQSPCGKPLSSMSESDEGEGEDDGDGEESTDVGSAADAEHGASAAHCQGHGKG